MDKKFTTCWLTVNRACNMRCKWCYAKDTNFLVNDEMTLDNAQKVIDLCVAAGIKNIVLIGGEPTVYSNIFDVIDYCKNSQLKVTVVSNGLTFFDEEIVKKYMRHKVDDFSISLKAPSKKQYKEITGIDCYDKVLKAIKNLSKNNAHFSVSMVLTMENIDNFINGLSDAKKCGAKSFGLSFCYNFDMNDNSREEYLKINNPYKLAKKYSLHYEELKQKLDGCHFSLAQSLPFCVWNRTVIEKMNKDNHLRSTCQLLTGNGLLFDTDLSLIPCNAMYKLKYGKFGVDFNNYESLSQYLKTDKVTQMFNKLRGLPDKNCLECDMCKYCGGGCVTNWTNYSFKQLLKMKC